jgi:hypothetical protein
MFIGKCSSVAISLATLALIGGAASGQPAEQPQPDAVAKLIAQLSAADFRSRQ